MSDAVKFDMLVKSGVMLWLEHWYRCNRPAYLSGSLEGNDLALYEACERLQSSCRKSSEGLAFQLDPASLDGAYWL